MWKADEDELAGALEALLERALCSQAETELTALLANDLSVSQLRCLVALGQDDRAMAIHTLADRLGMTMATAGRTIDRLVADDLVTRREDPADRRVRRVSLSAQGRQIVSGIDEARRRSMLTFVRSLPPSDAARLLAALRPITGPINDPIAGPISTKPRSLEEQHA